ncbi:MAG: Ig-like domain-containing protein [Synergistaceae bacterium]|nr:Ig-like domain-containing protein [Synergistaceae bacterium]
MVDSTPATVNPALNFIPGQMAQSLFSTYFASSTSLHIDERGKERPKGNNSDVGAYESESGGGGSGGIDPDDPNTIAGIEMSGIPNTMVRIGQTCSLTALVTYQNGETSGSEPVTWASSNPSVAAIDQYGNLVSLRLGTTTISVTTQKLGTNNERKTHARELTVSEEWISDYDNNIDPEVRRQLGDFNDSYLSKYAAAFSLLDFDSRVIDRDPFAGEFESAYKVAPTQVTNISDNMISFESVPASSYPGGTPVAPSVSVILSGASSGFASAAYVPKSGSGGGVLPVRVTYNVTWPYVSELLGRQVTKITQSEVRELFGRLKLAFTDRDGNESILVDAGGSGIDASEALTEDSVSTAGRGRWNSGNNGLTLVFDIFLSDADPAPDGKPRLIEDRYLTVADGVADDTIEGSLWLLGAKASDSGSGGGGGCDAGIGFLAAVAAALAFLAPRGRRRN